jgi:hypothetical protein
MSPAECWLALNRVLALVVGLGFVLGGAQWIRVTWRLVGQDDDYPFVYGLPFFLLGAMSLTTGFYILPTAFKARAASCIGQTVQLSTSIFWLMLMVFGIVFRDGSETSPILWAAIGIASGGIFLAFRRNAPNRVSDNLRSDTAPPFGGERPP